MFLILSISSFATGVTCKSMVLNAAYLLLFVSTVSSFTFGVPDKMTLSQIVAWIVILLALPDVCEAACSPGEYVFESARGDRCEACTIGYYCPGNFSFHY